VAYEAVMPESAVKDTAERGVLEWLNKLDEFGFCFVSGVPATTEATEQVIRRMAHIRETHCELNVSRWS
jgi:trimethyllysine dioxygenase